MSEAVGSLLTSDISYLTSVFQVWAIFGCAEAELAGAESFGA